MATVKIIENMFEPNVNIFEAKGSQTVEEIIRNNSDGTKYDDYLVECYDCETGKTIYAPITDDNENLSVLVTVNGQTQDLDYSVEKNDVIEIIFLPLSSSNNWSWHEWSWTGAWVGLAAGAVLGGSTGSYFGPYGILFGAIGGGIIGFFAGGLVGGNVAKSLNSSSSSEVAQIGDNLPDTRGATNQNLTGNPFPFVLGKHLATPFIVGSPFNNIYGYYGQDNYITALYLVGNAPLKITELKLGDIVLAHNQSWAGNKHSKTVFHGLLTGIEEVPIDMDYYQNNVSSGIDLKNRQVISGSDLISAGWTDAYEGSCYTIFPQVYSKSSSQESVVVTPIRQDGTILTPSELQNIVNTIFSVALSYGGGVLLYKVSGKNSEKLARKYAEELHKAQASYYFGESDNGDIVSTWANNDISVEILQQGQNGEPVDYGEIYPYAKKQNDVNANVLYIVDNPDEMANVSYKGVSLKNGLRNQPVIYTEEYPMSAKVELDFPSGIYKTYTNTTDGNSEVRYEQIPLWVDIQWRVSSEDNLPPNAETHGVIDGELDSSSPNYWRNQESAIRGWHSFSRNSNPSRFWISCLSVDSYDAIADVKIARNNYYAQSSAAVDVAFKVTNIAIVPNQLPYKPSVLHKAEANESHEITIFVELGYKWTNYKYSRYDYEWTTDEYKHTWKKSITFTFNSGESERVIENHFDLSFTEGEDFQGTPIYFRNDVDFSAYVSEIYIDGLKVKGTKTKTDSFQYPFPEGFDAYAAANLFPEFLSRNSIGTSVYNSSARSNDIAAHTNNTIPSNINKDWLGADAFNFKTLGGTNKKKEGLNEIRFSTEVNFVSWARENFAGQYSTEEEFVQLFKEYFYPASNTTKSIEVRVVRLSPNYQNETTSSGDNSPASYNDLFTWKTLTSTMIDDKQLTENNQIVQKRPLSEEDMRKYCLIAIKAKSDNTDQLGSTLKKFTCIAESFAPYFDKTERKWYPEEVTKEYKYFAPNYKANGVWHKGAEISEAQYIEKRQAGEKSIKSNNGNSFTKGLVTNVIRTSNNFVNNRYILRKEETDTFENGWNLNPNKYLENNVASMILLAGIGSQAGINALGYDDYDLLSLAKMYEFCESVKDGSSYNSEGYHYDKDGNYVHHNKGDIVDMKFTANAYIYNAEKLEDIISKLCIAGRCVVTRNRSNQLTFIVDKPEPYHVALINQANTISSSYSLKFDDNVSGLMITYPDENDGYNQNSIYAMKDAETVNDHRGNIESYQFAFVTNPYQAWSLGRYLLANKVMNKEVVTKKIGMEGYSIGLGNIVCVQDDTMMIGTDFGGRITELIEDDDYIYGFLINTTYHFTDEREEDDDTLVKKGVMVMQPSLSPYEQSRVVILRLAPAGTQRTITRYVDMGNGGRTIRTEEFTVKKGQTNVVILKNKVSKHSNYVINDEDAEVDTFLVKPKVDNIVGFGNVNSISALYRVIGIKPDNKHNYELSLLKYQPELYEYGRELPSFQNNMTKREYVGENFALSESTSFDDINSYITRVLDITEGKIAEEIASKVNTVIITLYKRSSSELGPNAGPTDNAIYDFSPDVQGDRLVFENRGSNGWSTTIPEGTNSLYAIVASVVSDTSAGVINKDDWSTPRKIGSDRDTAISVYLYQRCYDQPALPNVTVKYNLTNGKFYNTSDIEITTVGDWKTTMESIASADITMPLWITTAAAVGRDTDEITAQEWCTPLKIVDGEHFSYNIEPNVQSVYVSPTAYKLHIYEKQRGITYKIEAPSFASAGSTVDVKIWKYDGNGQLIYSTNALGYYVVERKTNYNTYYKAEEGNCSHVISFPVTMGSYQTDGKGDIRIKFFKDEDYTQLIDMQTIVMQQSNNYACNLSDSYIQIPVNSDETSEYYLHPVTSDTTETVVSVKYGNTELTCVTGNPSEGEFKITDVTVPKDSEGNVLVTADYDTTAGKVIFSYSSNIAINREFNGTITVKCIYNNAMRYRTIPFTLVAIDNGNITPSDQDSYSYATVARYKPNVDNLTFNFTKTDDGDNYEEYEGFYKFLITRKNGQWETEACGQGSTFTYDLAENYNRDLENPATAYLIQLYKDDTYTEYIDQETIPVIFNDNEARADLTNENISLLLNVDGTVKNLAPTQTGLTVYKGAQVEGQADSGKLEYSSTPIATLIQTYGEANASKYYNIEISPDNCVGTNLTTTDPKNITINAITSVTNTALGYAARTITIKYLYVEETSKIVGYSHLNMKAGFHSTKLKKLSIPIYEKIYAIKEVKVMQFVSLVSSGEPRRIKFAVGPFGLDTSSLTDMSTLTWYDNMPARTSSQCMYMAVENATQSSNQSQSGS